MDQLIETLEGQILVYCESWSKYHKLSSICLMKRRTEIEECVSLFNQAKIRVLFGDRLIRECIRLRNVDHVIVVGTIEPCHLQQLLARVGERTKHPTVHMYEDSRDIPHL
jgi:hypothetical protein